MTIDRAGGSRIHKASWPPPRPPRELSRSNSWASALAPTWLVPAWTAIAWGQGQACSVAEGGYGQRPCRDLNLAGRPAAVTPPTSSSLIPWTQRLFVMGSARLFDRRVEDELTFWRHRSGMPPPPWACASGPPGTRLRLGSARAPKASAWPATPPSAVDLVRAANAALRATSRPAPTLPRPRAGLGHDGARGLLRPCGGVLLDQTALQRAAG